MLITADSKIRDVLSEHPELRDVLIGFNPRFERLNNRAVFAIVGRWARMSDVAKVGGVSLCELLHLLNRALDQEDQLTANFPDCLGKMEASPVPQASDLPVAADLRLDGDTSIPSWWEEREGWEVITVAGMKEDPFQLLMRRAQDTPSGSGFSIIQAFRPDPLLRMLEGMGFEHRVAELELFRYQIWFFRPFGESIVQRSAGDSRVPVVLQSATPVVWPVLMRMMQSPRIQKRIRFEEVKVWDETEKHLGWLVKEKADVSFSAVVASVRLFASGLDIRLASVDVWENFHLLSQGNPIRDMADFRGRTVRMPLIKNAPPMAITAYLLKAHGISPEETQFLFGEPFGRPDVMAANFARGTEEAVLLREPEASFALHAARALHPHVLSFGDVWKALHPQSRGLPNAGLVFKGQFLREHPEEALLIEEELRDAVAWVNGNRSAAAELSWDIMGRSREEIELFLERVVLQHAPAEALHEDLGHYLRVLTEEGGMTLKGSVDDAMGFLDWRPLLG